MSLNLKFYFIFLNQSLSFPQPTHIHHSNVTSLVRLQKVCHTSLQTAANEDAVVDVIEEDGSKCVDVP